MNIISKKEIISNIANQESKTKKEVEIIINQFLDQIGKNLENHDKVQLIGFGSFNAKNLKARKGRNPQTGEEITIKARRQISFVAGKELKGRVNNR